MKLIALLILLQAHIGASEDNNGTRVDANKGYSLKQRMEYMPKACSVTPAICDKLIKNYGDACAEEKPLEVCVTEMDEMILNVCKTVEELKKTHDCLLRIVKEQDSPSQRAVDPPAPMQTPETTSIATTCFSFVIILLAALVVLVL